MKNNTSHEFYFTAYPLSVIGGTSTSNIVVTRSSANGISLKILPALDAMPAKIKTLPNEPDTSLQAQWDIGWFNNYE